MVCGTQKGRGNGDRARRCLEQFNWVFGTNTDLKSACVVEEPSSSGSKCVKLTQGTRGEGGEDGNQ